MRAERSAEDVERTLAEVRNVARGTANLLPPMRDIDTAPDLAAAAARAPRLVAALAGCGVPR